MAELLPWELAYATPTPVPDEPPPWELDYSGGDTATATDEGGFLAKINRALGIQDYQEPLPEVSGEEGLVAPEPWRNFEEATRENIQGMLPHDIPSYLRSIAGPAGHAYEQAKAITEGDVGSVPLVGRVPELIAAEETPAFSKERIGTAERVLMDLGMLAGAVERPTHLRRTPLEMPDLPPSPTLPHEGFSGDIKRALERRFTLQEPPPEPPLAPSVPIEQTLPNIPTEPPLFNPELGPMTRPEFPMPLRTETMQLSPAERNGQILERRKGILARKAELTARAAGGEQGLEAQLAAVEAELKDPVTNPVVHAPPVEVPVRSGEFAKPGYTAVETPPTAAAEPPPPGAGAPVEQPSRAGPPPTATAPEPYTPEAAAARAAQPPEPVAEAGKAGTGEGGISIKNEYTDTKRQELGFPEAVEEARRGFDKVWEEGEATDRRDPGAKRRLVEDINKGKVKAIDDLGDALLLREQVRAQGERNDAVKAVNEAVTDADKTAAKARLQIARDDLQAVYDADKRAGRSQARGLGARRMLAKEDYSLTQMEARKRAANNGERLNEGQLKEVEVLHNRITELSERLDALDKQRFSFRASDVGKEAAIARKSGKRLTDYTGEAAQRARERINRQLHGLGAKPAPPTLLYDYAVVGADHLARGLTKFSDWSAQMIKEFGEKVKPHLQDLWKMARAVHDSTAKAFRTPEEARLERYKTGLAKQTAGVTAKIQRGDFAKTTRQKIVLDKAAYKMKGNLQRLKNEFERGVAKDAYRKMSPADKFWQHFVGVERAMKLSSPAVFEKLGLAAAVREVLAPIEGAGGYAVSKVFPRLARGTRYGADLKTVVRAEIKAKAALFTEGMKDAWENLKGKETGLEAISDKYGRQPDFWYNRVGKIHAAVKAPVKRAEFVRSLEHRMDAAVKVGEDINHPEVMDRLATESALDANRAIFQQNTVVSKFFSMLDRLHPAGGRAARFVYPVVKIPVNLFKELVTYHAGAPVAAAKIGRAYWKGIETLEPVAREAIIRQLVKGSVGGAALLWGYFNRDKVHDFFAHTPPFFQHTPIAMAIHEGSIIKSIEQGDKEGVKDLQKMAKYDIPFMYTMTGLAGALNPHNPHGWRDYLYGMIQGTVVPQILSWTAKELDKPTPFSITDKPAYRRPGNIIEAVTQGIPGLRQNVPAYTPKEKKESSVSQRLRAKKAARTRARNKAREED